MEKVGLIPLRKRENAGLKPEQFLHSCMFRLLLSLPGHIPPALQASAESLWLMPAPVTCYRFLSHQRMFWAFWTMGNNSEKNSQPYGKFLPFVLEQNLTQGILEQYASGVGQLFLLLSEASCH